MKQISEECQARASFVGEIYQKAREGEVCRKLFEIGVSLCHTDDGVIYLKDHINGHIYFPQKKQGDF